MFEDDLKLFKIIKCWNDTKCCFITYTYIIDGIQIKRDKELNDSGVIFDDQLTNRAFNSQTKRLFYCSLVRSLFSYLFVFASR